MKKTIIAIVILTVVVIGGLLASAVKVQLTESRSVEKTRIEIRDSLKQYKKENNSLVGYCDSSLYQTAVSEFVGESDCVNGTEADGKDFSVTLSTVNAAWECKLQHALDAGAQVLGCSELASVSRQEQSTNTVTSTEVTSESLFPESRDIELKLRSYDQFSLSMRAPSEWDEQAYGFRYSNNAANTDRANGITEMVEIDFETNVDNLSPKAFAERKINLLANMQFAYSDYRLEHLEPVSVDGKNAVYSRAVEYAPDGKPDFIEDRYFITFEDKMLIVKYRREAEIVPIDFVALVNTLQFQE